MESAIASLHHHYVLIQQVDGLNNGYRYTRKAIYEDEQTSAARSEDWVEGEWHA